jgi:hypothetical protein
MRNGVPAVISEEVLEPSPEIAEALASAEYTEEAALADLIDNSLDAGATNVLIRVVGSSDRVSHVLIADNGRGMTSVQLRSAMSYAKRRSYGRVDLGMYGLGLKTASLSQCSTVTVISKSRGQRAAGRQWNTAKAMSGWLCGILDNSDSHELYNLTWNGVSAPPSSGTVVRWDSVKFFQNTTEPSSVAYAAFRKKCCENLGLIFHRFIERNSLSIDIDFYNETDQRHHSPTRVKPLDPFGYPSSGAAGYPTNFQLQIGNHSITACAHVWPKAKKTDPNYRLIGSIQDRQGMYFYRNDRLVQCGGWSGMRTNDSHGSLARVAVELPPTQSESFRIRYTKTGVDVSPDFSQALKIAIDREGRPFTDYMATAISTYRTRGKQTTLPVHPMRGLSRRAVKIARDAFTVSDGEPFQMARELLVPDRLFDIDFSKRKLLMNKMLFEEANEASLVKAIETLVYLLTQQHLGGERINKSTQHRLEIFSRMGAAAIREKG